MTGPEGEPGSTASVDVDALAARLDRIEGRLEIGSLPMRYASRSTARAGSCANVETLFER